VNWSDNFLKFSKEKYGWALSDRVLNFALTQPSEIQNKIFIPLSYIYFSSRGGDMIETIALAKQEMTPKERVKFTKESLVWRDKGLTQLSNISLPERYKFSNQLIDVLLKMNAGDPFVKGVESLLVENMNRIMRLKRPIQELQPFFLRISKESSDDVFLEVFKAFFEQEGKAGLIYQNCKELFDTRDTKSLTYRERLGEIELDLLENLNRSGHLEYQLEEIYKKSKAKLNFINAERIHSEQKSVVGIQLAHAGLRLYAASLEHNFNEYNVLKMEKLCEQTLVGLKDEEIKGAIQGGISNHPIYEKYCLEKLLNPIKTKTKRKTL
jgi:hypothetical protein